ncbi:NAD-dependent epimerase/dehydratase family protein [Sphingomonas sp. URHD0057]|uniref:NAD-dependent epimerase/dehydratase family protein n=1 Tax=Sphingomonas sp. URHD0057 TaxID=1380389 RepID=UPI00048ADD74|nr:NAD-dependent epimerase/dehydratase family protein [Sphingomonas sp. URHD0057]
MTVLVTGVAGFIGSAVARLLLTRDEEIVGLDNLNDYYDPSLKRARIERLTTEFGQRFRFAVADFADPAALGEALAACEIERIVHLGAQAGVRYSLSNPAAYVQSNLVGHSNIVELARARDIKHLVYASSSSVYGNNSQLPFRVEDRTDHPLSLYAATKKCNELISESYANLYRIPTTGLRFFTVYGPWGRPDMAMWIFTEALLSGKPIPFFNGGRMRRDFTFVDDAAGAVVSSLDSPPADDRSVKAGGSVGPHALYNIGNNRSEALGRVIEILEEATGKRALLEPRPMQAGDVPETFADIGAAERDLGFRPATSIEVGIPRFVDWYRDYHGLA